VLTEVEDGRELVIKLRLQVGPAGIEPATRGLRERPGHRVLERASRAVPPGSLMDETDLTVDAWWIVMLDDGEHGWQVHTSTPRTRTSAEQFAADLNTLGSTRERGYHYAAASLVVTAEVPA
jgi:hypothetical protein